MKELARCEKKRCRELLRFDVDRLGRLQITCEGCERNKAGRCRRCPRALVVRPGRGSGGAKFCPECRVQVDREHEAARRPRKYARNARWRAAQRERLNREAREWWRAHPMDDGDRLYLRLKYARHMAIPGVREHRRELARKNYRRRKARAEAVAA